MEKIIELICEEARRRPGKRLVPKLERVNIEVWCKVTHLISELNQAEHMIRPYCDINRPGVNDP